MTTTAMIEVKNEDLQEALRDFFRGVLAQEEIKALLVPMKLPAQSMVMPTLVSDPDRLEAAEPLAPVFPLNASRMVSRLTRKPTGGKIAAILRPCEIRAFIELVKLKQGRREDVLLIGVDCLGSYSNRDFQTFAGEDLSAATTAFYRSVLTGGGDPQTDPPLTAACRACETPVAETADLSIGLFGVDVRRQALVTAQTPAGEEILSALALNPAEPPAARAEAVETRIADHVAFRDRMFAETAEAVAGMEKMSAYFSACVNCYNCRVACPVCYCKECVFVTDAFNHDPSQYLKWASRKGAVKLPTDTIFYHITRLAHMSTACVGCGQCSNACPNDIPVMELFRLVSHRTQAAFDYSAGRDIDEPPPLSVFYEKEFEEVVGIGPTQ